MTSSEWWSGVGGALLGALIGSFIPLGWSWWQRRSERHGEIQAMHVEFRRALEYMEALRRDNIAAPLYRLPTSLCKQALPKLIGDDLLTLNEVGALVDYVNAADEINRGLDRSGEAHAAGNDTWLRQEHSRTLSKVDEVIGQPKERYGGMNLFDAAQAAVFRVEGRK